MSKKIIISIISEQSVPNLVLIKNNKDAEYFINIVTDKMKKYSTFIQKAINHNNSIQGQFIDIEIKKEDENNIINIQNEFKKYEDKFNTTEEILVNITGGTKILAIALYEYFNNNSHYKNKCSFLYLNKDNTSTSYNIVNTNNIINMQQQLTLTEYLNSYGLDIMNPQDTKPKYKKEIAKYIMATTYKYKDARKILSDITMTINNVIEDDDIINIDNLNTTYFKKANLKQSDIDTLKSYLNTLFEKFEQFNSININEIPYKVLKYIHSIFFEEYIYYKIYKHLPYSQNKEKYIKTGVKLFFNNTVENNIQEKTVEKEHNDQELDILFIYNNTVYYIECKTFVDSKLAIKSMYKQDSIAKKMGIKINKFFTVIAISGKKENLEDKMNKYDIQLLTRNDYYHGDNILKLFIK